MLLDKRSKTLAWTYFQENPFLFLEQRGDSAVKEHRSGHVTRPIAGIKGFFITNPRSCNIGNKRNAGRMKFKLCGQRCQRGGQAIQHS